LRVSLAILGGGLRLTSKGAGWGKSVLGRGQRANCFWEEEEEKQKEEEAEEEEERGGLV